MITVTKFLTITDEPTAQAIISSDYKEPQIILIEQNYYEVKYEIERRKYQVDIEGLKKTLQFYKNCSNREIAEKLNVKESLVEHWFRKDKYFSIPSPKHWVQLKELLKIETDEFDKSILEVETDSSKFDMRGRIYCGETCNTLTTTCGTEYHMIPEGKEMILIQREFGGKITEEAEYTPTLEAAAGTGGNNMPMLFDETKDDVVRRMTPLECERLQGYPDGWTDIPETIVNGKKVKCSDAQRYKALGNSICTPFWQDLLGAITQELDKDNTEQHTLGSLFDGIGGFPLSWEHHNGKGSARWASEIEPFPIAVTMYHFPEQEEEK